MFIIQVHRLVVVDDDDKVIGIISLSDLLMYLVLRPTGECGVTSLRNEHAPIEEKDENLNPEDVAESGDDKSTVSKEQDDSEERTQCQE